MHANEERQELDPYRSPAVEAIVADDPVRPLTRSERAVLTLYYEHRGRPFTVGRLVLRMIPNWCLIATLMIVGLILAFSLSPMNSQLPLFVLVSLASGFAGVVIRDLGVARRLVTMWPLLNDVFDWSRVEARLHRTE